MITDNFIYIHLPKTGGTFVTHVLDKIHNRSIKNILNKFFRKNQYLDILKHDTCSAIPFRYIDLPILSTVRNPYDRYVSQYEFKWWRKYPEQFASFQEWKENCKNFPDVAFEEFVYTANKIFPHYSEICRERNIGFHTEQFILYYFKNPGEILKKINSEFIKSKAYQQHMYNIHFIHTEDMNIELYEYLLSMGYKKEDINFILKTKKIYPVEGGRTSEQKWKNYYSDELRDFVRKKERYLFAMIPEYDL